VRLGHRRVGTMTVTAVSDGILNTTSDVMLGIDTAEAARLTGTAVGQPISLDVNCFLVQLGGQTVLIDAGAGSSMAATLGRLPKNLLALGVAPEAIDVVLLTHCHSDHSNGLIDGAGSPVFSNAVLVMHEQEAAFWLDRDESAHDSERIQRNTRAARAATAPYRERMRRVPDGEVLPGISAVLRAGHTPGHTTWLLQSGADRLLIWGDIVHVAAVQVPRPDIGLVFDFDPVAACAARRDVFDWASSQGVCVAGAHLAYPGFAQTVRWGEGFALQTAAPVGALRPSR
jgi:glyoxylase-like metal-dependent hydrolase (beta-lactamase superfamily II)